MCGKFSAATIESSMTVAYLECGKGGMGPGDGSPPVGSRGKAFLLMNV